MTVVLATTPAAGCPICQSIERDALFGESDRLHDLPCDCPIVRCVNCRSAYLTQRTALAAYYPAESFAAYDQTNARRRFSRGLGRHHSLKTVPALADGLKA
jgi:hypothetical protein